MDPVLQTLPSETKIGIGHCKTQENREDVNDPHGRSGFLGLPGSQNWLRTRAKDCSCWPCRVGVKPKNNVAVDIRSRKVYRKDESLPQY